MITVIPQLIKPQRLPFIDEKLKAIEWSDGTLTAHGSAKNRKKNSQCVKPSEALNKINALVLMALKENNTIVNTITPTEVLYPMLNKHMMGEHYGKHIDRPLRYLTKKEKYFRADVSCSVFLSDKNSYDGGELVIQHGATNQRVKLNKGDAVLYPTSYLHEVKEVTRGERICAVTWMQCAIADSNEREMVADIFKLNNLVATATDDENIHGLASKVYNNLFRKFARF